MLSRKKVDLDNWWPHILLHILQHYNQNWSQLIKRKFMDILGEFLKNGNFKLVGQESLCFFPFYWLEIEKISILVVDKILDELLEEISDQVKGAGLDPLPIPDIQLPFSMDNVSLNFAF